MTTYGAIKFSFWDDPKIRELDPEATLLMVYLLTNRHKTTFGLFVLAPPYIDADLGWNGRALGVIKRLEGTGLVRYDEKHRAIMITNYLRHNVLANWKVITKAVGELNALPDTPLLLELFECLNDNQIDPKTQKPRDHYKPLLTAILNRIANRWPNRTPYRGTDLTLTLTETENGTETETETENNPDLQAVLDMENESAFVDNSVDPGENQEREDTPPEEPKTEKPQPGKWPGPLVQDLEPDDPWSIKIVRVMTRAWGEKRWLPVVKGIPAEIVYRWVSDFELDGETPDSVQRLTIAKAKRFRQEGKP